MRPYLLIPLVAACAVDGPDVSSGTAQINGTTYNASQYMLDRAIKVPGCTATRIGPHHALTAHHCFSLPDQQVRIYRGGPTVSYASYSTATITDVEYASFGCHDAPSDCDDDDGNFADMMILELGSNGTAPSSDALTEGSQATLAWKYPGDDVLGKQVGAGAHGGGSNPDGWLKWVYDRTDDSSDSDGSFITLTDNVDPGDSGGPFYVGSHVVGVLSGHGVDQDGQWSKYASVPFRLHWILSEIGYTWPGTPPLAGTKYNGTILDAFIAKSERVCQYACENTESCEAYSYASTTDVCLLVDDVTGKSSNSLYRSALRYGSSGGLSGQLAGYIRHDGINAVVHKSSNGSIWELWLGSDGWHRGDLLDVPEHPPLAGVSGMTAFRRADGVSSVMYKSNAGQLVEIALGATGGWHAYGMSTLRPPGGDPVAMVRHDGISAVYFRDTIGHILEHRMTTAGWVSHDISADGLITFAASSDPSVYTRSDGFTSVVYRAGTSIVELWKSQGEDWSGGTLAVSGMPTPTGKPYGFTQRNGINAVVYRSTGNKIIELYLSSSGSGWMWRDITGAGPAAASDPVAFVRTDGTDGVIYRSSSGQVIQLVNDGGWNAWNMTTLTGQSATSNVSAYIRGDGYNEVLAQDSFDVIAYSTKTPLGSWTAYNLSENAAP